MAKRTKLIDRILPDYTHGEELFNFISHVVGGGIAILILVAAVLVAALLGDVWAVVTAPIYGGTMVALYTMSSVYHGLTHPMAKKVMQVLDHCTIYFLIAGTYTPIALAGIRPVHPAIGWVIFGIVWGCTALAATLTAIDLRKYRVLSMLCYIAMGWCVIFFLGPTVDALGWPFMWWTLAGGIAYTVGAVLYGLGKKCRYMHSVFHIFVIFGSVLQAIAIIFYVLPC